MQVQFQYSVIYIPSVTPVSFRPVFLDTIGPMHKSIHIQRCFVVGQVSAVLCVKHSVRYLHFPARHTTPLNNVKILDVTSFCLQVRIIQVLFLSVPKFMCRLRGYEGYEVMTLDAASCWFL